VERHIRFSVTIWILVCLSRVAVEKLAVAAAAEPASARGRGGREVSLPGASVTQHWSWVTFAWNGRPRLVSPMAGNCSKGVS